MESIKHSKTLGVPAADAKHSGLGSLATKSDLSASKNSSDELPSPVDLKKSISRKKSTAPKEFIPEVQGPEDLNRLLGSTLNAILDENKGSNVIASPLSLYSCFAMIGQGLGGGKTFKELQKVFGFTENTILSDSLLKSILKVTEAEGVTVKMVSHLYTNKNVKIKSDFVEELKTKYHAIAKSLDFSKPETVDEINQQISESTEGLVSGALSQLNPTSFSMIIASIYFKGQWLRSFSEEQNFQHDFKKADKTKVKCTFMANKTGLAGLHTSAEYEYLSISYKDEQTKLVIEMAKDGILKKPDLQSIVGVATKAEGQVEVFIPKFKSVFTCDVIPIMKNVGIQKVFSASKEFTNITDHQMCVNNVLHTACIQVDEVGTEAFCFIMMEEIGEGATAAEVPKFVADKPFYFHIVDSASKIILFSGTVEEPRF